MTDHILKCWPEQFAAVQCGAKNFEFRKNDRGFQVGDTLRLQEYYPDTKTYSGAAESRSITYVLADGFGIAEGFAVLGLSCEPIEGKTCERFDDEPESCHVCGMPLDLGDLIYYSDDGMMHDYCIGPERACFYNADENPLSEGEPIPRPLIWNGDNSKALQLASDARNDEACVDRFGRSMKAKLAADRAKGRGGWDNPAECSMAELSRLLHEHVAKRDPLDVANFAMMIHQRGGKIEAENAAENDRVVKENVRLRAALTAKVSAIYRDEHENADALMRETLQAIEASRP